MKLSTVYEKIAHKKLAIDLIKKKESEILVAIDFNLIGGTMYDIWTHCLARMDLKESLDKKIFKYLQKICTYLSKMSLYEYDLICQKDYNLLSGSLIFVAFKIIE